MPEEPREQGRRLNSSSLLILANLFRGVSYLIARHVHQRCGNERPCAVSTPMT
jgi:hypothetical protein